MQFGFGAARFLLLRDANSVAFRFLDSRAGRWSPDVENPAKPELFLPERLQQTHGVQAAEALGFEVFAERLQGGGGDFVDALLCHAELVADFRIAAALPDGGEHDPEAFRHLRHRPLEGRDGFRPVDLCGHRFLLFVGGVLNQIRLGGLQRLIEHVCVVMVMPNLFFVEAAEGIADGLGGVGGEVAFGRIELAASRSERLLRLNFNLRQVEAGDVREIASDMPDKRQEFGDFGVHFIRYRLPPRLGR